MIEHTQAYAGLYFVLMGRLSPLDGIGPKEIRLERLLKRAADGVVREVVLATNFTNEGEATAHYIGELLTRARARRSRRLARGVPVGGELEYVDSGTLGAGAARATRARPADAAGRDGGAVGGPPAITCRSAVPESSPGTHTPAASR